jgi:F420 biosynthesis protein FbiB-like protein
LVQHPLKTIIRSDPRHIALTGAEDKKPLAGSYTHMHSIINILHTRRSIRHYLDRPVPPESIDQLLEAATWAPSAHNRQPWRFAVIATDAAKAQLADRMGERLRSDRLRDGDPIDQIERDVKRSRERITTAPVVIAVCLSMMDLDHYPDDRRNVLERAMAMQSVAASIQNLLLTAHDLGLGACWMCAPLFCPDVVREVLHLPDDWEAQALVTIGYPKGADEGKRKDRADFRQKTIYR